MTENSDYRREALRACELLRIKTRHAEVLQGQLKRLMARIALVTETVDIAEPIAPLSGPRLGDPGAYPALAPRVATLAEPGDFWPTSAKNDPALTPSPGYASLTPDPQRLTVVGFLAIGLGRSALERAFEDIEAAQSARPFAPLFVYDGFDFDLFRARGWVFEWIPPAEDRQRVGGAQSWDEYLASRIALIRDKWRLTELVPLAGAGEAASQDEAPGREDSARLAPTAAATPIEKPSRGSQGRHRKRRVAAG